MSDKIREALAGMLAIVDESRGVEGYHFDGDIAAWDEFPEVEAARAALAEQPATAVPEGITLERIERHAQPAGGCPSSAKVVLLSSLKRLFAGAPAAPVAVGQEPVAWALVDRDGRVRLLHISEAASRSAEARWSEAYSGCSHVPLYAAPPAAEQPDTVPVPRELLERAMYAKDGRELIEANRELRALLAGGEA